MPEAKRLSSQCLPMADHAADVGALATAALSAMAERRAHGSSANRAAHLREMFDASIEPSGGHLRTFSREMLHRGVPTETIIDVYVPEVARRLGAAWMADRLSFVEVSIGAARLQALARELLDEPHGRPRRRDRVAVIVPKGETHTLGAVILSGQLRRLGFAVLLHLGDETERVVESLRAERPAAIMISASHPEALPAVSTLVAAARPVTGTTTTFTVGGPILDIEDVNVLRATGADHAISDPVEALGLCRLETGRNTPPMCADMHHERQGILR